MLDTTQLAKAIGKAIFYASIVFSLGSILMSSTFSVRNFAKDQETLQNAADALLNFLVMGSLWTVASILVLYSSYGYCGAAFALIANIVFISWIYISYMRAFRLSAEKYNLQMPRLYRLG